MRKFRALLMQLIETSNLLLQESKLAPLSLLAWAGAMASRMNRDLSPFFHPSGIRVRPSIELAPSLAQADRRGMQVRLAGIV